MSLGHDYSFDFTGFGYRAKSLVSFPLSPSLLEFKHKSLITFKERQKRGVLEGGRRLNDRRVFTHNFIKDCSEAKASGWIHVIIFQLRSLKHLKQQSNNGWKGSTSFNVRKKISSQNFIKF